MSEKDNNLFIIKKYLEVATKNFFRGKKLFDDIFQVFDYAGNEIKCQMIAFTFCNFQFMQIVWE